MNNNTEGMAYQIKINTGIVFGNGQRLKAECFGDKRGIVAQKDGSQVPILLKNVKYVPQLCFNLFSITAALNEGYKLDKDFRSLRLSKKGLISCMQGMLHSALLYHSMILYHLSRELPSGTPVSIYHMLTFCEEIGQ